jgi:hypothetical protein
MGVRTRIQPISRDVQLIVDELLSPAARSRQFAAAAREYLDDADNTNRQALGRVPRNTTYVDGRRGAALETVKPSGGVIIREYDLILDALLFVAELLRTTSPVGKTGDRRPGHPGFYRASHTLYADGTEVPAGAPIPDAEEYVFLSTAPYARRLERRHTIYEKAASKANSRFSNVARIKFGWRSPLLSYVAGGANRAQRAALRNQPARQSAMRVERSTRVPAIIVSMGR